MILAAGLGTRLKPFTDKHPKAMAKVNGKSLLKRNVEYLKSYGVTEIIINLHHFPTQIMDEINMHNTWGIFFTYSDELNKPLETGGALKYASWYFRDVSEPFVLINVDILTDLNIADMIKYHKESKAMVTLAVINRPSSRQLLFDQDNRLCGWQNSSTGEKKISINSSNLIPKAFSGLHIISPGFIELMGREGVFSIIDEYLDLTKNHLIKAYDQGDCKFIDVGKPESIAQAEQIFE